MALLLFGATSGLAGGAEEEEFIAGSGNGYAQIYRVGPTAGRLSLAPIVGLSLADYLSTVGRGEAKAADWAGIGVAEPTLPDNTPVVRVASTEEGAGEGKSVVVAGQKDASGTGGGALDLFARATKAPMGESRVRIASMSVPGVFEMFQSEARSVVGILEKGVRRAVSVVEIGRLLLAGAVELSGLRWEAVQETRQGAKPKVSGRFTIDGVKIAGMPLPLPAGGSDLEAVLEPVNMALAPTGFAISLPAFEERGGQASVSPLAFEIINSPAGRQYLAPILEALQPVREPVADAFIDLAKQIVEANEDAPDASVAVLAADLTLGIFSGSSQLHIEFGGTSSFTEGESFENPFGSITFKPPAVGGPQTVNIPGRPGRPAAPGTPGDEGELVAAPVAPGTRTVPGGRGGIAVAVGIAGIGVAIALAVADYRRMRAGRAAA
jgi:hypothetical protein